MLQLPDDPRLFRICAFDPGSNIGVATLDYDPVDGQVYLIDARTFNAVDVMRHADYREMIELHGARPIRGLAHEENMVGFLTYQAPHQVISESPYFQRIVNAFSSLTECVYTLRRATFKYNPYVPFFTVDPPTAKKSIGMKIKKGMTKQDVMDALLKLDDLQNPYGFDYTKLDEHAIDAIAVGYSRVVALRDGSL